MSLLVASASTAVLWGSTRLLLLAAVVGLVLGSIAAPWTVRRMRRRSRDLQAATGAAYVAGAALREVAAAKRQAVGLVAAAVKGYRPPRQPASSDSVFGDFYLMSDAAGVEAGWEPSKRSAKRGALPVWLPGTDLESVTVRPRSRSADVLVTTTSGEELYLTVVEGEGLISALREAGLL